MIFKDLLNRFVTVYLDDILVFSANKQEYLIHLRKVFEHLLQKQFYFKLPKCKFSQLEIQYLGYLIIGRTIAVDPTKTKTIVMWPKPTCVKEVQQFVGLANYYNEFIPKFSAIPAPLTDLLSSKHTWEWTAEHQKCFATLSSALCEIPVFKLPDLSKPFVMEPDASYFAVNAVLLQKYDNGFHPIAYFSKKYLPAERNYAPHDKELLAIFKACMKWRCYINCHQTTI